jgi:hypothetical protein
MDTRVTTGQLANSLGTSLPRVLRAADSLPEPPERTAGGHRRLTAGQVEEVRQKLGTEAVPGHSREESFVLAALLRRPLGLRSYRAIARASGISPTTAVRVTSKLESEGLVRKDTWRMVEGVPHDVAVWRANLGSSQWSAIAPSVRSVHPKMPSTSPVVGEGVPRRLWHLFWNVDPSQLSTKRDGTYLAGRIMQSDDPLALGWMRRALNPRDIARAAGVRGLAPARRALGRSLAAIA